MSKKSSNARNWKPATLAIHGPGRTPKAYYAVSTPIVQTSNYYFDSTAEVLEFMKAKSKGRAGDAVLHRYECGDLDGAGLYAS
jgi:cystathionine beta-lyase/cystathionine gamma-synthase